MPYNPIAREYRALVLEIPQETAESDAFIVEGYATLFDRSYQIGEVDGIRYFERIARDALTSADLSDVIFLYNHEGKVLARLRNGTLRIEADERGLKIWADLGKSAAARELYEEICAGLVTQMSWAFSVDLDDYDRVTRTRTIKRIKKVYDVSAVSIPANSETFINARSYVDGVIDAERQEKLQREAVQRKIKKIKIMTEV